MSAESQSPPSCGDERSRAEKEAGQVTTRPLVPGLPTRVVDASGVVKRHAVDAPAEQNRNVGTRPSSSSRESVVAPRLFIGPGVKFNGRVTTAATLVVAGDVEAEIPQGNLEIPEGGRFKGSADVQNAVIAGCYEGTLVVRGRLTLAETASVHGRIWYAELEIACGGRVTGEVEVLPRLSHEAEVSGVGDTSVSRSPSPLGRKQAR